MKKILLAFLLVSPFLFFAERSEAQTVVASAVYISTDSLTLLATYVNQITVDAGVATQISVTCVANGTANQCKGVIPNFDITKAHTLTLKITNPNNGLSTTVTTNYAAGVPPNASGFQITVTVTFP